MSAHSAWREVLEQDGYVIFDHDPATALWADAAHTQVCDLLRTPAAAANWQCEGTWFVGVDALGNDPTGAVADVPLAGPGPDAAQSLFGAFQLHAGQVSIVRPGYPKPRQGESEAAFGYRLRRDGAHLDGLLPIGPERRRYLREPHAWILGIPLTQAAEGASPLAVWRGSHHLLGPAMSAALAEHKVDLWADIDLTARYQEVRRTVFDQCDRILLPALPGQTILLHRHILHGISPWQPGATSSEVGRAVAYFRPQFRNDWVRWLD